eukprot:TRINITY_DN21675_c0_g1_i1.p1 TRINITY_DN21675_c0_g1~~TRINITY_DN21675_c0_g1_i1.p1  ORF type:complete len:393 (+),score=60.82 TRINITY_DN21675_c0_g1_i1:114-1292(+)
MAHKLNMEPAELSSVASAYRYKLDIMNPELRECAFTFDESMDVFSFEEVDKKRALRKQDWPSETPSIMAPRYHVFVKLMASSTEITQCDGCASWKEKTRKPFMILTPNGGRSVQFSTNPFLLLIFRCCPKFHSCSKQFHLVTRIVNTTSGAEYISDININRKKFSQKKRKADGEANPQDETEEMNVAESPRDPHKQMAFHYSMMPGPMRQHPMQVPMQMPMQIPMQIHLQAPMQIPMQVPIQVSLPVTIQPVPAMSTNKPLVSMDWLWGLFAEDSKPAMVPSTVHMDQNSINPSVASIKPEPLPTSMSEISLPQKSHMKAATVQSLFNFDVFPNEANDKWLESLFNEETKEISSAPNLTDITSFPDFALGCEGDMYPGGDTLDESIFYTDMY